MPNATSAMPLDRVLPYFRSVMPGVSGVVLASARGEALAHDLETADAGRLATQAVQLHVEARGCAPLERASDGTSIFVPHEAGVVLVVFLDAARLTASGTASIAVAA